MAPERAKWTRRPRFARSGPVAGCGSSAHNGQRISDARALKLSECMRSHGVPGFPDPIVSAPSGNALVLSIRGMYFQMPAGGLRPGAPAFRQAVVSCGVRLPSRAA